MKDPFASDAGIDSPSHSLKNVDGCYNNSLFKVKSFANSRRALQSGAEKISRTFRSVKNSFGNLSQHFRLGGRRRHRLAEMSPCRTPSTPVSKKILGRSPAKLYSPFGIETPHSRDFRMSPYMPDTPEHGYNKYPLPTSKLARFHTYYMQHEPFVGLRFLPKFAPPFYPLGGCVTDY